MKQMFVSEPARRGGLRLWLGKRYFCARRWLWWHTSGVPPPGVPLPGPLFPAQHPTASKAEGRGYVDAAEQGA